LSCSRDVILLRRSSISFRMVSGFPPFAIVLACCCLFSKIRFFAVLKNPGFKNNTPQSKYQASLLSLLSLLSLSAALRTQTRHSLTVSLHS
jgi:hypothetical protein